MFQGIEFANPYVLLLLVIIPLIIGMKWLRRKKPNTLQIPSIKGFEQSKSIVPFLDWIFFLMKILAIALLIIAIARPRIPLVSNFSESQKGVDIFLVVDVSLSMLAQDVEPDRLTALKEVAQEFSLNRKTDRIGLLAYSGEALTKVPLTSDRNILITEIQKLRAQELEGGTAIGVGLATAINHFKNSKATSKIIILLTDGVNNDGFIDPIVAAKIAKSKGIKVYTIGLGTNGSAPFPVGTDAAGRVLFQNQKVEIDEQLLQEIAGLTHGKYFRATSKQSLSNVYNEIDRLEKSDINDTQYYNYDEKYRPFALLAFLLIAIEIVLKSFFFKSIK